MALALLLFNANAQDVSEPLVPGALGVRTDGKGNTWNLEQNGSIGRVGNTMVNSGLALEVNGEKFVGFQPMMTTDGRSIVLQGRPIDSLPGLQVQRRIRILSDTGGLRYAEMFFNGSTDPISLNIALITNFSGNYKTFLTNRGRTEPVLLGEEESGIIVLPGATQSTRAFLFSLAGIESSVKPTLTARNRYAMTFQYSLTLAPGETRILLHKVAQTVIPQNFERRRLLDMFSPYSIQTTVSELPGDWKAYVANGFPNDQGTIGRLGFDSGSPVFGVEPSDQDILLIGEDTRLFGRVTGSALNFESAYGRTEISLEDLIALQDLPGKSGNRLYLRDEQIWTGKLSGSDLVLVQTGGGEVPINLNNFDRLVFAKREHVSPFADGSQMLIETYRGDRFTTAGEAPVSFRFLTAWGELQIASDQIVSIRPAESGKPGLRVELSDYTKCYGWFADDSLEVLSKELEQVSLKTSDIRSVFTPLSEIPSRWIGGSDTDHSVGGSIIYLSGGQVVVGNPISPLLSVMTGGVELDTEVSQIQSFSRAESNGDGVPRIQIKRWDGGVVTGAAKDVVLSFRVGERLWRIPLRDIDRVEGSSPELTETIQTEVSALILQLGSDSWEGRERASRELGAYGYLARPLLKKHLQLAADPEVNRRLERLLSQLD